MNRVALALAALATWVSCASESRPVIRIASDATFGPFHFVDEAGMATGFEIELARLVAERAGYASQVVVVPYEALLPGLDGGEHDIVAATTGITREREQRFLFTTSYFQTCQAALVRSGEGEPKSLEELRGRRVGAAGAGTSVLALENLEGAETVVLGKGQEGVATLLEGTIDALVVDEYDAVEAARASQGRLRVLPEPVALESYAFVLARDREGLRAALDEALDAIRREGGIGNLERRFGVARGDDWPVRLDR